MAEQEDQKKEDKFDVDAAGEAAEYISLDQARVVAIQHAQKRSRRPLRSVAPRAFIAVVGVVVGVLLLAGCDEPDQRPGTSAIAQEPMVSAPVTVPVRPDTPTELVSPLGNVTVVIPAGSVADPSEVSYRRVEPQEVPTAPAGFVVSDKVFVMNADGTGQTRLTFNDLLDGDPGWSPDGSKIAFTSNRDLNLEIYVMNADGTGQTRLTFNTALDRDPSWSP